MNSFQSSLDDANSIRTVMRVLPAVRAGGSARLLSRHLCTPSAPRSSQIPAGTPSTDTVAC